MLAFWNKFSECDVMSREDIDVFKDTTRFDMLPKHGFARLAKGGLL